MNIYYDENMPFAQEFFSDFGNLVPFSGRELCAENVKNADVLLVRSITKVNEALLNKNTQLKFVGTATIGVDHIDQAYLQARNVPFSSAPGCNAVSVAEYVLSAMVVLAERYLLDLFSMTVGIVGGGNTGSRLSEKLTALGIKHVICDPLLAGTDDERTFVSLDDALACDIISLHVPLTKNGEHATYHLLNQERLEGLSEQQILINACRGEIIDNQALLALKQQGKQTKLVLDVWENEPNVLEPLIEFTEIASAHIAGYSLEGKARGTEMLYQTLCKQLNVPIVKKLPDFLPKASIDSVKITQNFDEKLLNQLVKLVYDVRRDDGIFRQQLKTHGFDTIRRTYPARREFSAVSATVINKTSDDVVYQLGFSKTIR